MVLEAPPYLLHVSGPHTHASGKIFITVTKITKFLYAID